MRDQPARAQGHDVAAVCDQGFALRLHTGLPLRWDLGKFGRGGGSAQQQDAAAGCEQATDILEDLRHGADRARGDDGERPAFELLGIGRVDRDVVEAELEHRLAHEAGLLVAAIEQRESPSGMPEGERDAGQPCSAAEVQHLSGGLPEVGREAQGVEDVARHGLLQAAGADEIVCPVPAIQECQVRAQVADEVLAGGLFPEQLGDARLHPRRERSVVAHRAARERSSRCTRRMAMAAGVIPGMRRAWPRVAGRMRWSFSRASRDRAVRSR